MSFATAYKTTLIIVFLLVVFELGQAMYFMMVDRKKHGSLRMVWALTRRVAFSLLLIILIVVGIQTGILHPYVVPVP